MYKITKNTIIRLIDGSFNNLLKDETYNRFQEWKHFQKKKTTVSWSLGRQV